MKAIVKAALLILGWLLVVTDAVVFAVVCAEALAPHHQDGNLTIVVAPFIVGMPLVAGFLALPIAGLFRSTLGIGCAVTVLAIPLAVWVCVIAL